MTDNETLARDSPNVSTWDYIKELRAKGVYKNKQKKFLSHIAIYVHQLQVYKVIVFANPDRINKPCYNKNSLRKRYCVTEQVVIHTSANNPCNISFPKLKKELDNSDIGYKMFIFDINKDNINVYEGEELL